MEAGRETLEALLIEDNPGDARLVEHHLNAPEAFDIAGDVTLTHEERLTDGLNALDRHSYDVLFLDLGLPESTGLATLETVQDREPEIPIIVLTGLDDREAAISAIQSGAQDYLPKEDLNADLLARSVRYAVERHQQAVELRRQNERLDEFVNVVSHDLRNPLNVAEIRLGLARGECDSEHLEDIDRALDRMGALIEDLLALARGGETVAELEPVELAAIVESCWTNVDTGNATILTDVDRTVYADDRQLKQVFENLIRNAIEHGNDDITVTVGELEDGFYVEDDGPGIPEEERDDVFDAGYSTNDDGTGFGLNIVKQVADAHDWDIHVTEGTEGGARFEITGVESIAA